MSWEISVCSEDTGTGAPWSQVSSPASVVVPSTVPRTWKVSDQGRKWGVGGGPGQAHSLAGVSEQGPGSQTLHTAGLWPRIEATCSGWTGSLSWSGRWQVRAACSAGACGWQCQQWLWVASRNCREGLLSPPLSAVSTLHRRSGEESPSLLQ